MNSIKYWVLLLFFLIRDIDGFSQTTGHLPELTNKRSWSMVLLPDPQGYTKFKRNQPLLELMMNWIESNRSRLNIKLVLCTGDMVEQSYVAKSDSINGDQPSSSQWKAISKAFSTLDNQIPYILCTGNHDYGTNHTENRYSQFNSFFPPGKNMFSEALLVDMAPNADGVKTMENACYEFVSPLGQRMLIFSLEYAPRASVVEWAKHLSSLPKYKYHTGIVLTHSYMSSMVKNNQRLVKADYSNGFSDFTTGSGLWDKLINPSPNIQMVFCGHVVDVASHQGHVGFREDRNLAGLNVKQMMFNAQNEGGNWKGNGGDCWLRILEFLPDEKTVLVKTFSPLFGVSPATSHLAWRKEAWDEFNFTLDQPVKNSTGSKVQPFRLSNYTVPVNVQGGIVGTVTGAAKGRAILVSDTSGRFVLTKDGTLQLKNKNMLTGPSAKEYEVAIRCGTEEAGFILVKDEFAHNKVVAHRGAWKDFNAPRNSLRSLKGAIALGCEGSEFDVWLSADGVPVISHDAEAGGKKIEETTVKELQKTAIGTNQYVPTLEEYLLAGKGQNSTRLVLEIKSSGKGQERTIELAQKAVAMVQALKMQAWVYYISFNYGALQKVLELDPSSKVSYLWGDRTPSAVAKDKFWGIDYPYEHYKKNPEWIKEAHEAGLTVNGWTVNDQEQMRTLLNWGADLITTDEPEKLLSIIKNERK